MVQSKRGPQQVRIIGGKYKGRKLRFVGGKDLRPTLGRTRETLFNWLRGTLEDARCLDLFAGSGVLGLEALSQGAAHVTFVERNARTRRQLKETITELDLGKQTELIAGDAIKYLEGCTTRFEVAFVDPPFAQPELLERAAGLLCEKALATEFIYVEAPRAALIEQLCERTGWREHRNTRAGDTFGALLSPP